MNKFRAAGILFRTPDDYFLLAQRSGKVSRPYKWGCPGGGVQAGEEPKQAAEREVIEELGSMPPDSNWTGIVYVRPTPSKDGLFYSYVYDVPESVKSEWEPNLTSTNPFAHETAQVKWLRREEINQLARLGQLVGEIKLPEERASAD